MWGYLKDHWAAFVASFHDSETIVWARVQIILGIAFEVISNTDMSIYFDDKRYLTAYLILNGIVAEYLRRRREDFKENVK